MNYNIILKDPGMQDWIIIDINDQINRQNFKLHLAVPCEWQRPKHLDHLPLPSLAH